MFTLSAFFIFCCATVAVAVLLQSGADPVIKDDGEYPDWLWKMDLPMKSELEAKGVANLSPAEARRYYQLQSTATIKENNMTR